MPDKTFLPDKATTAPRMTTTPMAIRLKQSCEVIPIGPYFFSLDITIAKKTSEKTASMATYSTPVAQAARDQVPPGDPPAARSAW